MIEASAITKAYQRDGHGVQAIRNADLKVGAGEFVTIRGASGSGKSSLLNILGCLDTPTSGVYRLAGTEVSSLADDALSAVRARQIGFIFQAFNLLPRSTALENVELPMIYADRVPDRGRALALLARMGLEDRARHFPAQLSGGEQQRVAVARALINDPPLILADEPTGNLDQASGDQVMDLLEELNREGRTILLVTHDDAVASRARRVFTMRDGVLSGGVEA